MYVLVVLKRAHFVWSFLSLRVCSLEREWVSSFLSFLQALYFTHIKGWQQVARGDLKWYRALIQWKFRKKICDTFSALLTAKNCPNCSSWFLQGAARVCVRLLCTLWHKSLHFWLASRFGRTKWESDPSRSSGVLPWIRVKICLFLMDKISFVLHNL